MHKDRTAILFIITAFISGLCGAFFYPLSSLFIVEALGASPMMLSAYMVTAVVSSVIVSQVIARYSDQGWQRKRILIVSLSCYLVTVVSFIFIREFWLAIVVVTLFGSVSGASFGQLFALGREYGDSRFEDSTSFLSIMRAGIAIAWVFGPPVAFILKAQFGFNASFAASAFIVCTAIVVIACYLPDSVVKPDIEEKDKVTAPSSINFLIVLYAFVVVFAFAANNLYIVSMPLYLSQELKVEANWLGVLFGVAALCEIPVMFYAGKLAARFGTVRVMSVGLVSGCLFFVTMLIATDKAMLIAAQIFNGIFIGSCATLGMVALQDMMRDRLGTASTLFSNLLNVSMLAASLAVGIVGELFSYYSAFYVCLFAIVLAYLLLSLFAYKLNKKQRQAPCPATA
ncbi:MULTISPECIES: sugar efflux transporter [Vibrio]|uniref:MFS transporter n=1 Tax=Vibrio coralliilyticus TaxID=190893 RepID=A0AAP6ZKT1_9VIBR|nr:MULTISPECIES: sugar efflux transporter [Vibrio]MCM5508523.1 sugar efflux transporter [Vibrio sp. SCSIO 43169]NOJ23761.1 MFS transporter [Vibrio coralliilyticus]QFT38477.1 Sugar efflux transporter C [Vibrio sp. THAF64]QGM36985.1 Sugar efflux transporter C [Vibrio sp. THAF191d]QGN72326.1 Sugar efflux transporter C [Vibrio sp. THAF191c]